jgi:hypothetical protein
MCQSSAYPVTPSLWRRETRCGGALVRGGTATRVAPEMDVNGVVST